MCCMYYGHANNYNLYIYIYIHKIITCVLLHKWNNLQIWAAGLHCSRFHERGLGNDLALTLCLHSQHTRCSGALEEHIAVETKLWNHDDGYSIVILVIIYIYIWWWFMIMIHEYDEHNQCIVCILFFSRDWLTSVVPEFVFSATCWVALYGSPEIKGFTDLNEPFCCHLNRTPSDLARWT